MAKGKRRRKQSHERDAGPDYIDSWTEYQDHRYDPGYYVGGKIPYFTSDLRPAPLALLLSGILVAVAVVVRILIGDIEFPSAVFLILVGYGLGAVLVYAGLKGLRKGENHVRRRRGGRKKTRT